jgi:hypothetical protein
MSLPIPNLKEVLMTDKKPNTRPKILRVFSSGEVRATLTERQTNSGLEYPTLELSKEWTSQVTGRRAAGTAFFLKHLDDIIIVVKQSAAWLREDYASPTTADADQTSENPEHHQGMPRE